MENCQHKLEVSPLSHRVGSGQRQFFVIKCQSCNHIFSVHNDDVAGILSSLVRDVMKIETLLAKIEGHLGVIAKKN